MRHLKMANTFHLHYQFLKFSLLTFDEEVGGL